MSNDTGGCLYRLAVGTKRHWTISRGNIMTEEDHENPQLWRSVAQPRHKPGTIRIQARCLVMSSKERISEFGHELKTRGLRAGQTFVTLAGAWHDMPPTELVVRSESNAHICSAMNVSHFVDRTTWRMSQIDPVRISQAESLAKEPLLICRCTANNNSGALLILYLNKSVVGCIATAAVKAQSTCRTVNICT